MKLQISSVYSAATPNHRPVMQDEVLTTQLEDGAHVLGVFDGEGPHGAALAAMTAIKVEDTLSNHPQEDALGYARLARSTFRTLHNYLENEASAENSGTTATVAIFKAGQLAIAYVGDNEAVFYPLANGERRLTKPHTPAEESEVERVQRQGGSVENGHFAGGLAVSRAIGHHKHRFVSAEANITLDEAQSGILLLATKGVWGKNGSRREGVGSLVRVYEPLQLNHLAHELVHTFSGPNHENASAVVARIAPEY